MLTLLLLDLVVRERATHQSSAIIIVRLLVYSHCTGGFDTLWCRLDGAMVSEWGVSTGGIVWSGLLKTGRLRTVRGLEARSRDPRHPILRSSYSTQYHIGHYYRFPWHFTLWDALPHVGGGLLSLLGPVFKKTKIKLMDKWKCNRMEIVTVTLLISEVAQPALQLHKPLQLHWPEIKRRCLKNL